MKEALQKFERFLDQPIRPGSRVLLVLLVFPLVASFLFPLWRIEMFAPQYPEGLSMDIFTFKVEGGHDGLDIQEINTLNHYIGMAPIDGVVLADLDWIPFVFGILGILILRVAVIGNIRMLLDFAVLGSYAGAFLLFRFWYRLWILGHDLDPRAPVEVDPFMPAFFGSKQIANFTVSSFPAFGAVLISLTMGGVVLISAWHLWLGRRQAVAGAVA
jgi:copper chaperone NosL